LRGIIDRLEGDVAVVELEGKRMKEIYVSVLPYGVKEGDVIEFVNGKWWPNQAETQKLKTQARKKLDDLFE